MMPGFFLSHAFDTESFFTIFRLPVAAHFLFRLLSSGNSNLILKAYSIVSQLGDSLHQCIPVSKALVLSILTNAPMAFSIPPDWMSFNFTHFVE